MLTLEIRKSLKSTIKFHTSRRKDKLYKPNKRRNKEIIKIIVEIDKTENRKTKNNQ